MKLRSIARPICVYPFEFFLVSSFTAIGRVTVLGLRGEGILTLWILGSASSWLSTMRQVLRRVFTTLCLSPYSRK